MALHGMVEQIVGALRALPDGGQLSRAEAAKALGVAPDDLGFLLAFGEAKNQASASGEMTIVSLHRGGIYEKRTGEAGADAALAQSRRKVLRGRRAMRRAVEQASMAPLMTDDERKRKALERQAERAEIDAARGGLFRRSG